MLFVGLQNINKNKNFSYVDGDLTNGRYLIWPLPWGEETNIPILQENKFG